MPSLKSLGLATDYRTGRSDPVLEFYQPCLERAIRYDRAVGYFRSSIYLIVGRAMVEFARRGGTVRLICSPALYVDDIKTITQGYYDRARKIENSLSMEIDTMMATEGADYRTRVLATLVGSGALDIHIAIRPGEGNQYHEKLGIFTDSENNCVSFIGSANETWNAWHQKGNFESIEVFCSWRGERELERTERHRADFESLWVGQTNGIHVSEFPDAVKNKLLQIEHPSLADIDLVKLGGSINLRTPLPHQIAAIENWIKAGSRGVLEHATGSGKTYTAITAMKPHLAAGRPVLILVPSSLLLEQWAKEVAEEIPGAAVMRVGAGHDNWRQGRLKSMTLNSEGLGSRVVIATMQTAASSEFLQNLRQGSHLMIVADEVHQIGSQYLSNALSIDSGPRMGLSATPKRYGDPEGTQRIFNYFGEIVLPIVTLQDAIRAKRLVEYTYYPHPVYLTNDEIADWNQITKRIRTEVARQPSNNDGSKPFSEKIKLLLIQRSRIAKKAKNKIELGTKVIIDNYTRGQHWLVYCEDSNQLKELMLKLKDKGLNPIEYHSSMKGDKVATLDWFRQFGGILVSIKCLDEGVDIPAISHALILASSQNPRQFIQRRGRVLRHAAEKDLAVIHDAIVIPASIDEEMALEALVKAELLRALEFAGSALNKSGGAELRDIAVRLDIDIDTLIDAGIEEE